MPLTARTKPQFCPVCFKVLDAFTNMSNDESPQAGDMTVCIGCASVLRWKSDMSFETAALIDVPIYIRRDFARIVEAVKEMHAIKE